MQWDADPQEKISIALSITHVLSRLGNVRSVRPIYPRFGDGPRRMGISGMSPAGKISQSESGPSAHVFQQRRFLESKLPPTVRTLHAVEHR